VTTNRLMRLADAVRERRAHLGLAQGELADRGGPSIVTVGQIERCQIARPQAATLRRLDDSLGWTRGSASRVLAGGVPEIARSSASRSPLDEARDRRLFTLTSAVAAQMARDMPGVDIRDLTTEQLGRLMTEVVTELQRRAVEAGISNFLELPPDRVGTAADIGEGERATHEAPDEGKDDPLSQGDVINLVPSASGGEGDSLADRAAYVANLDADGRAYAEQLQREGDPLGKESSDVGGDR
jgi:transcriptional regulator with XRE-family HTH domain